MVVTNGLGMRPTTEHVLAACSASAATVYSNQTGLANGRCCAGECTTTLRLSWQKSEALRCAIRKYSHIHSLHLDYMSLHFSHFEDIGKLPNLRHIAFLEVKSVEEGQQALLEGHRVAGPPGARRSAFQFLDKVTSLELGGYRAWGPLTSQEFQGITHLTNLQQIILKDVYVDHNPDPCSVLNKLSALTFIEMSLNHPNSQLELGISQLTRLQSLSFLFDDITVHSPIRLSGLQALTALAFGPGERYYYPARQGCQDLKSVEVPSGLQKLALTDMMGVGDCYQDSDDEKRAILTKLWEEVASFTSVKHLDLRGVHNTYGAFTNLAKMTQLTCLNFSLKGYVELDTADQQLAALSTLTSLDILRCDFCCCNRPSDLWGHVAYLVNHNCPCMEMVGSECRLWTGNSYYIYNDVELPEESRPNVGTILKAALPQANRMSVFAVEAKRVRSYYPKPWGM